MSPTRQAQARKIIEHMNLCGYGRLSVQSLAEFFHVSTRKLDPPLRRAEALEQVNLFTRMWPVFDLTALITLEAGRGARDYHMPYSDAFLS